MTLGFTGTSRGTGMTQRQRATVRYLFHNLQLTELHHGDCINSDAQADYDAHELSIVALRHIIVYAHPSSNSTKRAFCGSPTVVLPPKPYLARNRDIVQTCKDGLIAAPRMATEPLRKRGEGTWTTVGYARRAGRPIWIVRPDGTFVVENGACPCFDGETDG